MNIRMMEYSTCVSFTGLPFLFQRAVAGVQQEGGLADLAGVLLHAAAAAGRMRASTRAVSSAGEKGLVT